MPFYVKIKQLLKKMLPESLFKFTLKLWRLSFARFFNNNDISQKYNDLYLSKNKLVVNGGPFKGMVYIEESAGSVLLHKLIGYYEEILHTTIESVKKDNFDTIIDIGCAEGYYLIGLGINSPSTKLVGYDTDLRALDLSKKLYEKNNLTNPLLLETECTFAKLNEQISDKTLIICDAEGFEDYILDPTQAQQLKQVKKFIVETHEFAAPDVINNITNRFSATHNIQKITFKQADYTKYPFLYEITNKNHLYHLLRERGEQEQVWLIMDIK